MPAATAPARTIGVRAPMPGVVYPPHDALRRYVEAGVLPDQTMGQAFRAVAQQHAARVALAESARQYTYAELDALTDRLGAALLQLGLQPLDRVLFMIANCNELVIGWLACLKAGLIPVCTLAAHREQEFGYLGQHARARAMLVQGDDARFDDVAFASQLRATVPSLQWIVQARGPVRAPALSLHTLAEAMDLERARALLAQVPQDPFQVAVFQLSGGTTGVPKIIPRFHNDYLCNMRGVADFIGYRSDDVMFMPMPMMHNLNMGCCFGPMLLTGGTVAIATSLTPEMLGDVFRRFQPTWTAMAGPLVEKLRPAITSGALPVDKLRGIISANNAPALRELFGAPVLHIFGMTEGVIMFARPGDPQEVQDRMVGRPISPFDEVRLYRIGTEEEITEPDVDGECAFRGPYTIHGYYDAAERNAQAFTSTGLYRSGDLMRFRDIGGQRFWQFRGRTKDVVDRAGEKVNCEEVEGLVSRHPAISACAVIGMPDKVYGERVCAYVTLRVGQTVPGVPELGSWLQSQGLARFKWPERIEVLPELPLTNAGKLSKAALRKAITETLAAEQAAPR